MKKSDFDKIEKYMLAYCGESVHDQQHIYRVLFHALEINRQEGGDRDVVIAACLLHDIAREDQRMNGTIDHAQLGAERALAWLHENGFDTDFAKRVAECIRCHRYRGDNVPRTTEAKILYDADKIDAAGLIGIARTLEYKGLLGQPIYTVQDGKVADGTGGAASFFTEYRYKLQKVYDKMLTDTGRAIAVRYRAEAEVFYDRLLGDLRTLYADGERRLNDSLTE